MRAFFALGALGPIHRKLNPVSGKAIFDYMCYPNPFSLIVRIVYLLTHLDRLEALQGKIRIRIEISLHIDHSNCSEMAISICQNPHREVIPPIQGQLRRGLDWLLCFLQPDRLGPAVPQDYARMPVIEAKLDCHGVTDDVVGAVVSVI